MKNKLYGEPIVNSIVGKTLTEGRQILEKNGFSLRIINVDGSPQMSTTDVDEKRVNVFVIKDYISDIDGIG